MTRVGPAFQSARLMRIAALSATGAALPVAARPPAASERADPSRLSVADLVDDDDVALLEPGSRHLDEGAVVEARARPRPASASAGSVSTQTCPPAVRPSRGAIRRTAPSPPRRPRRGARRRRPAGRLRRGSPSCARRAPGAAARPRWRPRRCAASRRVTSLAASRAARAGPGERPGTAAARARFPPARTASPAAALAARRGARRSRRATSAVIPGKSRRSGLSTSSTTS